MADKYAHPQDVKLNSAQRGQAMIVLARYACGMHGGTPVYRLDDKAIERLYAHMRVVED